MESDVECERRWLINELEERFPGLSDLDAKALAEAIEDLIRAVVREQPPKDN